MSYLMLQILLVQTEYLKRKKKGGGGAGGEKATRDQPIPLFTLLKMGTPRCYAALQMTRHAIDKAY